MFDKLIRAYKEGKIACNKGKNINFNPYKPTNNSFSEYSEWARGFLSEKLNKEKHAE